MLKDKFTPKKIVEELNKYIISQDEAKKNVAISLRNRYRRKQIADKKLQLEITPKNIILIGPTGVGKTEIARRLAKVTDSPFIKVEATKFTEVGYVGKDVESIIKDLVNLTYQNMKKRKMEELREEYLPVIYNKIAKKLKPYELLEEEKAKIVEDIKKGIYDETEIEIEKKPKFDIPVIEINASSPDEGLKNLFDSISPFGKKDSKKRLKVKNAIEYLLKEIIEENIDTEEFIPEVLKKVEEDGIVFIDEIDKIAERESFSRGEVSRQGVQRDILPIVEGTTVITKFGPVKTDHILFIAAGAFSQSSPSDLMPELQGRFPVKVELKSLTKKDFIEILTKVDNNLLKQYKELLKIDGVELEFTKTAIEAIAEISIDLNTKIENIGARRLHTVLETVLKDIMFEAPFETKKKIKLNRKDIEKVFDIKSDKENLNNYIL
jgi:ATP-dependent HslUV protease ATP-binding subunit HslU